MDQNQNHSGPKVLFKEFSLLWPEGKRPHNSSGFQLEENTAKDLCLDTVIAAMSNDYRLCIDIRKTLTKLTDDETIIRFRQAVLDDLLKYEGLYDCMQSLINDFEALEMYHFPKAQEQEALFEVASRIGELESYMNCIEGLSKAFKGIDGEFSSEGFKNLKKMVMAAEKDPVYQSLKGALPDLIQKIRSIKSINIGINLNQDLSPVAATLVSINNETYTDRSDTIVTKLFGKGSGLLDTITKLHTEPKRKIMTEAGNISLDADTWGAREDKILTPLFEDLNQVMKKVSVPIAKTVKQFVKINSGFLARIKPEITFYLKSVEFVKKLQSSGMPMCRPDIMQKDARVCEVKDGFNIHLVLTMLQSGKTGIPDQVVKNDITMGEHGRILIITGPNRGGKTVYIQAAGLIQILAQAGLYVPGTSAKISPVDGIYTHYQIEERPGNLTGRFGDEAKRLQDIFSKVTSRSLVLLNESLSSTSYGESLYLAKDIMKIFRRLGLRALFSTHMHELAAETEIMNREEPGCSRLLSLVSEVIEESPLQESGETAIRRTYRLVEGPPKGHSYAAEIAGKYGISYRQLNVLLKERGLLVQ